MRMTHCAPGCLRTMAHAAPIECTRDGLAASMADLGGMEQLATEKNPIKSFPAMDKGAQAWFEGKLYEQTLRRANAMVTGNDDPTQPPPHYKATHRANGIEPGTECADVMVAFFGRDRAIEFLELEMFTKAMRLPTKSGDEKLRDLFKIEQATAKIRALVEQGEQ